MRHAFIVTVLLLAATSVSAWAAETTAEPAHPTNHAAKTTHAKPAHAKSAHAKAAKTQEMSAEKRRDLERRIEALEQKYEMQPAAEPGAR